MFVQQVYIFMRQENLERCLKGRELSPVPCSTTVGYSKLTIKKQRTSPVAGVEPVSELAVSYGRSTFQINEKIASSFSCFP